MHSMPLGPFLYVETVTTSCHDAGVAWGRRCMYTLVPIYRSPACTIEEGEHYLHCSVGPGQRRDIQECYRTLATECLLRKGKSVLVVGGGGGDSFVHLAGRDSLRAIALAGVPPGF